MPTPNLEPLTVDEYEKVIVSSRILGKLLSPREALKKIAAIDASGALRVEILDTCYLASRQVAREDQFLRQRKEDAAAHEDIRSQSQRKAIKKLVQFMKQYPGNASQAWGWALLEWKKRRDKNVVFPTILGIRVPLSQVFVDLLECYDSALMHGAYPRKGQSAWLHRFQACALVYPDNKPLDNITSPPDHLLNSLLFHLVFIFRQFTTPNPSYRCMGDPMLTMGRPHYDIVASLTNVVLANDCQRLGTTEGHLTAKHVRERVTRLTRQEVKLGNWPR